MAQDIVNSVAVCGENHNCTSISIDARDAAR